MKIIKLNATTSTNTYLKRLAEEKSLEDFTIVRCGHQTQGRGQKDNSWVSENGKNLIVSFLKKFYSLNVHQSFVLNSLVSLSIYEALEHFSIPELKVKWPNDIMSGNKKLCGILIENSLMGTQIKQSIVGFGLNVNQTFFDHLPNATSMKLASGLDYNLDEVFEKILNRMVIYFDALKANKYKEIKKQYESVLFWKDVESKFLTKDDVVFNGTIKGIANDGRLQIEWDNGKLVQYTFKEVQFLY